MRLYFRCFGSLWRRGWMPPLAIFLLALIVRLVYLIQFSSHPLFDTHIMDMEYFHRLATEGIPDTGFPDGPFFKAPLYPLFLKLIYAVFDSGPWAPRLVQAVLGSLTAMLTLLIAVRLFSLRTAVIAGILTAFAGTLVLYDGQLLVPTLAIFLNLLALYTLIVARQSGRMPLYLLSGIILGLSAVARPTILLVAAGVVLYLLWLARDDIRRSWFPAVLVALGLLVAVAPVTVRNALQSGEFVPIGTYAGINLYIGNNAQSDGVSATVPGTGLDWWHGGLQDDTRRIANRDAGRELTTAEQSAYWRNRALGEIIDNPGFFVSHVARKFLLFLGGYELANNFDIRYLSKRDPVLRFLILRKPIYWPWGILLPLGIAGMILLRRWRPEQRLPVVFLICYLPTLLLFFVTARYRLPMIPILAIFSAVAIESLADRLGRANWKRFAVAGSVFLAVVIVGRLDPLGYAGGSEAQGHQMMASLYDDKGDLIQAERYYRQALNADPTLPHANNDLGLLYLHRGEIAPAVMHLERAARGRPDEWLIQYNLGVAYKKAGRTSEAIDQFRTVLRDAPEMHDAAYDLALTWLEIEQPDSAIVQYRRLVGQQPGRPLPWFGIGVCHHMLRQADSAQWYYHRSLDIDSAFSCTHYNLGIFWLEVGRADSATAHFKEFLSLSRGQFDLEQQARHKLDSLSNR